MCCLGLLGIILMIIANELSFKEMKDQETVGSWVVKLFITLTTVALLILIVYYHRLDLDLYCTQNALHDWRIGLTGPKITWILLELAICAIHPMPRLFPSSSNTPSDVEVVDKYPLSYTSVDVGLGIPSKF
jgi:hypothetical protein